MKRTALKRSTKPIPRISKRGKARRDAWQAVKADYFGDMEIAQCQFCGWWMDKEQAVAHHKRKRSLGGSDDAENLLIIHQEPCHRMVHQEVDYYKHAELASENAANRGIIE